MANNSSNWSTYGDDCFNVAYELQQEHMTVSAGWMILGIICGLLLGIAISLVVSALCCKRWRPNRTGSNRQMALRHKVLSVVCPCHRGTVGEERRTSQVPQLNKRIAYRRISVAAESTPSDQHHQTVTGRQEVPVQCVQTDSAGVADILLKHTGQESEAELARQDEVYVDGMEKLMISSRNKWSEALVEHELMQLSHGSEADGRVIERVMTGVRMAVQDRERMDEDLLKERLNQMGQEDGGQTDINAIQRLHVQHRHNRHNNFKRSLVEVREMLKGQTKLTEEQMEGVLETVSRHLADLERVLHDHLDLQIQHLYERTVHRKAHLERQRTAEQRTDTEAAERSETAEKTLSECLKDEGQRQTLIHQYNRDIRQLRSQLHTDFQEQTMQLTSRLRQRRTDGLQELMEGQTMEMEKLLREEGRDMTGQVMMEALHRLLDGQATDTAKFWHDIDAEEANKIANVYLNVEQVWKNKVKERTDQLIDEIEGSDDWIRRKEVKRQLEMTAADMEKRHETERQMNQADISERLTERKKRSMSQLNRQDASNQKVVDGQMDTLQVLLDTHPNLHDSDRQKLLAEQSFHRHAFNNLMKLSRLKQEKTLERKMAQRRSRLTSLDNAHLSQSQDETSDGEMMLREEKERARSELSDHLAFERKTHVDQQTSDIAQIVARLQIGQARRQIQVSDDEKLLKRLKKVREVQLELEERAKREKDVDVCRLTQLMDQHRQQVSLLDKKLSESRHQQLTTLAEKLAEKKRKAQLSVVKRFNREQNDVLQESQNANMSLASRLVYQTKLEVRRRKAVERTITETRADGQMEREKLETQWRRQLDDRLMEQREKILRKLAELISSDKDESGKKSECDKEAKMNN